MIQYHVATLINNEQPFGAGIPKATIQRSGRELKSLQQRVKSKGRIRGYLMGKRVDFSARSVITPDPIWKIDQLGVPIKIAKIIQTFPEKVTKYNMEKLKKYILNGYNNYPGVKSIKKLDGV